MNVKDSKILSLFLLLWQNWYDRKEQRKNCVHSMNFGFMK